MSKLSIKVIVAGRNYPLTINEGEEEKIQQAANTINSSIKKLQDNYAVKDMQDLLAMTALQLATKSNTPTADTNAVNQQEVSSAFEKGCREFKSFNC
jgi:hypothetical protein